MAGSEEATPSVSCSRLIALSLARAGVKHMFGVVGIPITAVATHALSLGIRFISFRNEQSAAYAAAAYGFLTGGAGVLLTVSGPGFIHGLAGISHAAVNSWPLLMLSGSSSKPGDFQQLDQILAVRPFSKSSLKPSQTSHIPSSIYTLLNLAVTGSPGGCYLDLPTHLLHQTIPESQVEEHLLLPDFDPKNNNKKKKKKVEVEMGLIVKAVDILSGGERPLIVGGKGVAYGRGEEEMREMVEYSGIPFLPTPMGRGVLPDSHGLVVSAARSLAIGRCDVALVVGARLNWILHFGEEPRWSKGVRFVIVDVSEEEVENKKKKQGVEVGIVGDGGEVMGLMRKEMERRGGRFVRLGGESPWVAEVVRKKEENMRRLEGRLGRDVYPFDFYTPLGIIRDAIAELGSPAPIVVSEGANTMDIGRGVLRFEEPRTRLDAGTWGTMGVGLGYCIAAAVAMPDRLVIAVEGDSAFGFSAMEVETLVRYELPVVVIVFNNGGVYGGDRREEWQKGELYKDDPAPTSFVHKAAYHLMMEAFGGKGYVVEKPAELKSALFESFASRKPSLINVIIDPFAGVESGGLNHMN